MSVDLHGGGHHRRKRVTVWAPHCQQSLSATLSTDEEMSGVLLTYQSLFVTGGGGFDTPPQKKKNEHVVFMALCCLKIIQFCLLSTNPSIYPSSCLPHTLALVSWSHDGGGAVSIRLSTALKSCKVCVCVCPVFVVVWDHSEEMLVWNSWAWDKLKETRFFKTEFEIDFVCWIERDSVHKSLWKSGFKSSAFLQNLTYLMTKCNTKRKTKMLYTQKLR